MDSFAILSQANFFRGLSDDSRRALASVCRAVELRKRQVLFREGEEGHSMYLLNRGRVQLQKRGAGGDEIVIKVIQPGEVFAEVILFESSRYPVTASVLTPGLGFQFLKADIRALLRREEFRDDFIAMLIRKQRYLAERIVYLTNMEAEDRLLHFFREQFGGRDAFELDLAKKDIAAAIGAKPETLSRLLQRLQEKKILKVDGRHVRFLPPPAAPRPRARPRPGAPAV